MIALNELIKDIDIYRERYAVIAENIRLDDILDLEKERKEIQLKFEHLKADCNKKCNQLAKMKTKGEDISQIFAEIDQDDKTIKELDTILIDLGAKINDLLRKLPNLPDRIITKDIIYNAIDSNTSYNFEDFVDYLIDTIIKKTYFTVQNTDYNDFDYIKSLKDVLFSEVDSYVINKCSNNSVVLLCPEFEINNVLELILSEIDGENIKYSRKKSVDMNHSSADEYIIYLNDNEMVELQLKREFYTREFNIKYRNLQIDMTKFLNQIVLIKK